MVFNAVTNALLKSAQNVARKSPSEIFRSSSNEDDEEYYEEEESSKGDEGTQGKYICVYASWLKSYL